MLVMNAITEILKREGVSTMFCFPTTPIIESAAAAGIRPVVCRQERVGVHMADGCARMANGDPPGVFAMQYGPGAENALAIETHAMAYSHEKYGTRDLGGSYANIAKDLGGWSERVESPAEVGAAILRAREQNENGRAALLEFITSAETAFSHRRGAA